TGVEADMAEAQSAAAQSRDFRTFVSATLTGVSIFDAINTTRYVTCLREARERLVELEAPHTYIAHMCAVEAQALVLGGRWREGVQRLRVALGAPPGPTADVVARLTAAQLAGWQGRLDEAQAHLDRADELFADPSTFRIHPFDAVRAELAMARGDCKLAVATVRAGLAHEAPSTMIERLLPVAARALADEAQRRRD